LLQNNYRICYIVVYCLFTSAVPKRTRFTATQDREMLDYRFPTALQMVLSVAMAEQLGERSTSAILAYGLEANPSFIRKLMVPLTRDGIIVSTLGRNGSIHLGRPPEEITLRDIYLSVIEDKNCGRRALTYRPAAWSALTPAGTLNRFPKKPSRLR
jgi:Rrf2 family transcriptional repressor of oqxAB